MKISTYRTIIFHIVLYGCEIWLLRVREDHRSRVFENKVLIRIFGPKRDEITGGWKTANKELHNLYPSPDITRTTESRRMRWTGRTEHMEKKITAYRVSVGNPEGVVYY
jgi:hypothetical protein